MLFDGSINVGSLSALELGLSQENMQGNKIETVEVFRKRTVVSGCSGFGIEIVDVMLCCGCSRVIATPWGRYVGERSLDFFFAASSMYLNSDYFSD